MRSMILIGLSAAALSGCNDDKAAGNQAASERNVTSEVAATNDTTAIDAATGEAANMAADVDFTAALDNETDGNRAAPSPSRRPARPAESRHSAATPPAPDSPAADGKAETNAL